MFQTNMYTEHIILHVFLDYGNISFSIRYSSKLGIYKKKGRGYQNLLSFEKKNNYFFKKLTICQLSWGDKTLHWWSFHEDHCNKIHTNKTKQEDRKIVSIVK